MRYIIINVRLDDDYMITSGGMAKQTIKLSEAFNLSITSKLSF